MFILTNVGKKTVGNSVLALGLQVDCSPQKAAGLHHRKVSRPVCSALEQPLVREGGDSGHVTVTEYAVANSVTSFTHSLSTPTPGRCDRVGKYIRIYAHSFTSITESIYLSI